MRDCLEPRARSRSVARKFLPAWASIVTSAAIRYDVDEGLEGGELRSLSTSRWRSAGRVCGNLGHVDFAGRDCAGIVRELHPTQPYRSKWPPPKLLKTLDRHDWSGRKISMGGSHNPKVAGSNPAPATNLKTNSTNNLSPALRPAKIAQLLNCCANCGGSVAVLSGAPVFRLRLSFAQAPPLTPLPSLGGRSGRNIFLGAEPPDGPSGGTGGSPTGEPAARAGSVKAPGSGVASLPAGAPPTAAMGASPFSR